MKNIDAQTCKLLGLEIQATLQSLADKHGISIQYGGGSYDSSNATLKLKISVKDESGQVITREAKDFKNFAAFYGLKSEDFGKSFIMSGHTYEICGLAAKSRTYPILAKRADGKVFKFGGQMVSRLLENA